MHFVRAVGQAQGAGFGVGRGEESVLAYAGGAVNLNSAIEHVAQHGRSNGLDHRDLLAGNLVAVLIHAACGHQREQAGLINFTAGFGDVFRGAAVLV